MAIGEVEEHEVKVTLDDKTRKDRIERHLEVERSLDELRDEKRNANRGFNAKIEDLLDERKRLLEAIDEGTETVKIEVIGKVEERLGEVRYFRKDNGKPVPQLTRPLSAEERQTTVFEAANKASKKPRGRKKAEAAEESAEA